MASKILVIEDMPDIQLTIGAALKGVADLVFVASIAEAETARRNQKFDLCLLDVSLPDGDGFSFCANLRSEVSSAELPLFFITGKTSTSDKIQAFHLGADDYITKPFHPNELKARVVAKLRANREQNEEPRGATLGNLRIVAPTQQVYIAAAPGVEDRVDLSPLEFRILQYFVRHENHVVARSQLLESVWGQGVHVFDRTVDTHISHLRKKIANSSHEIRAIKGEGYTLRSKRYA